MIFLGGINLYLNRYLQREPPPKVLNRKGTMVWQKIAELERKRIMEIRKRDLIRIRRVSLFATAPIFVGSFVVGYSIADYFLKPLNKLQSQINSLEESELGNQLEIQEEDEIGELMKSFNRMSIRLKKSFDNQLEFVQNASHEIKTPLAVIQTNLDTAIDNPKATKKELTESIKDALDGIKELNNLSEALLTLSLPERLNKTHTNLNKLLKKIEKEIADYTEDQNVNLVIKLPQKTISKDIDKQMFKRAILNLVENAIKYSQETENPKVIISLQERNGKVSINVMDNGMGIPKSEQKNIFKRFYRIDKSRNKETGGFGLGLAITKKIIELHNGQIRVESKKGDTNFEILI